MDNIRPDYYKKGGMECLTVLKAILGSVGYMLFCKGQVIKYIWRYPDKTKGNADLLKARFYLDEMINMEDEH